MFNFFPRQFSVVFVNESSASVNVRYEGRLGYSSSLPVGIFHCLLPNAEGMPTTIEMKFSLINTVFMGEAVGN